jgi:hypothetical protein
MSTDNVSIQLLYKDKAWYTARNYTLKAGQPAIEKDTYMMKVGNGVTGYNALAYFNPAGNLIGNLEALKTTAHDSLIAAINELYDQLNNPEPIDITLDVPFGGFAAGDIITVPEYMADVVRPWVTKTFYPNLNPPNFSLAHAESANIEVNTTLDVDLIFTFDRGTIQATWPNGTNLPYAGIANNYTFYNADESVSISTGGPNFTFQAYKVVPGANIFKADVTYKVGQQPKDSKGDNFGVPLAGGTSAKKQTSFTGLYKHFWGPVNAVPGTAADFRLANNALSNSSSFTLNTGTTQTIFIILVAPGKSLSKVEDQDALNAVITSEYVYQGTVSVNDAGGTPVPGYKLYVKHPDVAYTSNHRHLITLA